MPALGRKVAAAGGYGRRDVRHPVGLLLIGVRPLRGPVGRHAPFALRQPGLFGIPALGRRKLKVQNAQEQVRLGADSPARQRQAALVKAGRRRRGHGHDEAEAHALAGLRRAPLGGVLQPDANKRLRAKPRDVRVERIRISPFRHFAEKHGRKALRRRHLHGKGAVRRRGKLDPGGGVHPLGRDQVDGRGRRGQRGDHRDCHQQRFHPRPLT